MKKITKLEADLEFLILKSKNLKLFNAFEKYKDEINDNSMIKLTYEEILNIAKMGADFWEKAKENNTKKTINEVCGHHVDLAISILKETDPDRF